jgi:phage gpG-like protein
MALIITITGDLRAAATMNTWITSKFKAFLTREAEVARGFAVAGFTSQGVGGATWKPLSPFTLAVRRMNKFAGTKALIHTGELRKSIITRVDSSGMSAFAGVSYAAINKDGKRMANIAKTHEYGSRPIVIRITPKMRKFLWVVMKFMGVSPKAGTGKGSSGTGAAYMVIRIPARPFMRPAIKLWRVGVLSRAEQIFSRM